MHSTAAAQVLVFTTLERAAADPKRPVLTAQVHAEIWQKSGESL